MAESFLTDILNYKKALNQKKEDFYHSLKGKAKPSARPHIFKSRLEEPGPIHLIAEVKKASPSKGLICEAFDPVSIAKIYADNGASAISVLTEDKYFLGNPEYIRHVREAVDLPILAKDFIIEEGQIYEAQAKGADAVLLIAVILEDAVLRGLIDLAASLGMDALVEIHHEQELTRACHAGAEIIGINNRDLSKFTVDLQTCMCLIPKVPKGKIIIGESGFKEYSDVKALEDAGAHGVLIGETLMREDDIGKKIKEVLYGES